MGDWVIEPGKIVTDYKDIEHIVDDVLAKMDEPRLDKKSLCPCIVPPDKFIDCYEHISVLYGHAHKVLPEQYSQVKGFYVKSPSGNVFVFMKHMRLASALMTYFHELGHIATEEFRQRRSSDDESHVVVCEMLAETFCSWAIEVFNSMSPVEKIEDPLNILSKKVMALLEPENKNYGTRTLRAALNTMLDMYMNNRMNSFNGFYHLIRERAYGGQPFDILWP